jgi:O-antigen/teichoic acid export membrane protein
MTAEPEVQSSNNQEDHARKVRGPTLRGDFLWTFFGNGIYAACQWGVLVLLAKTGSPELVGHYSFAIAVAMPIITFATFQLRSVQVTDIREQHSFGDYLGFRVWTMVAAMVALTTICFAFRYPAASVGLIELLGIGLAVEALSDVYYARMQSRHSMDRIAKSMIARGLLSLVGIALVMWLTRNLLLAVLAMVICRLVVTLSYDMRVCELARLGNGKPGPGVFRPAFKWDVQTALLKTAFPVGLVSVLLALNTSIPRYFIAWSFGPRELGIFSALAFFQSAGNTIAGALGQAAFGRLAREFADRNTQKFGALLVKLTCAGLGLGLAGVVVAAFAGKQILQIVYRPEYGERANLLTYLMIAAGMGYLCQFFGYAVTASRIFVAQIPLSFLVGLTLTGTCYLWVPKFGLVGAIWAIAAATLVQLIGYTLLLLIKKTGQKPRDRRPLISRLAEYSS